MSTSTMVQEDQGFRRIFIPVQNIQRCSKRNSQVIARLQKTFGCGKDTVVDSPLYQLVSISVSSSAIIMKTRLQPLDHHQASPEKEEPWNIYPPWPFFDQSS
jgi:hypothetical protein